MEHFVVKLEMTEQAESARIRTVKLVMDAESYTDAEKKAFEVYEAQFRDEYDTPNVASITPVKFNLTHDLVKPEEVEDGSVEYARIYQVKAGVVFKGEVGKRVAKILVCRAYSIEDAIKHGKKHLEKFYQAESVTVLESKETDLHPESPIFAVVAEDE